MKVPYFHESLKPVSDNQTGVKRLYAQLKYYFKIPKEQLLYLSRRNDLQTIVDYFGEDCSFITSNCFGGHLYQDLQIPYNSPTAGIFFYADDFAEFASRFDELKDRDIELISKSKWTSANEKMKNRDFVYPIGRFAGTDIELHFLHYHTADEAVNKWRRRISRVNMGNIVFLGMWQNEPTVTAAKKLLCDSKYKTFLFTTEQLPFKNAIYIDKFKGMKECPGPYKYANVFYEYLAKHIKQ